jgi:hypothetical protein
MNGRMRSSGLLDFSRRTKVGGHVRNRELCRKDVNELVLANK